MAITLIKRKHLINIRCIKVPNNTYRKLKHQTKVNNNSKKKRERLRRLLDNLISLKQGEISNGSVNQFIFKREHKKKSEGALSLKE